MFFLNLRASTLLSYIILGKKATCAVTIYVTFYILKHINLMIISSSFGSLPQLSSSEQLASAIYSELVTALVITWLLLLLQGI